MGEKTQKIQQHKRAAVQQLKETFAGSPSLIFTDYRGLNVQQITELRRSLREHNGDYRVVKNNYAKIALAQMGLDFEEAFLTDPTAVALSKADIGPVAKVLFEFSKESSLRVKGGVIAGRSLAAEAVEAISRLPSRQELLAMLMGALNAPLRQLLYVMNAVSSKLVRTLQAVAEQKARQ